MLEVTAGPAAGTLLDLPGDELLIGREQSGPGALGGDGELSRAHARVNMLDDGRLLVEDLESTNGTWLNGNRVPAPTLISEGDELSLGGTTLRVLPAASAPSVAAPPEKRKRPALRVVVGWAEGSHVPVDAGAVTLGTEGPTAAAFEGDTGVAAEHTRVSPVGRDGLLLEDLGGPGGTLVGGLPIPAPTVVRLGDRFEIGSTTLEVIEAAGPALAPDARPSLVQGGVREVPEGLFARIGMRAPVSREEVIETAALALGWSLALVLLIRELALGALDVESDLRALQIGSVLITTIAPITGNSTGFYKIFRRPDHASVKRYVGPTLVIPLIFIVINLARINHTGGLEVLVTVVVTLLPVVICAMLMLRLRNRVARRRVAGLRHSHPLV